MRVETGESDGVWVYGSGTESRVGHRLRGREQTRGAAVYVIER